MTNAGAVIDASALMKLAFNDPLTVAAGHIAEHYTLYAPSIIVAECANALWKAVRFAGYPQTIAETNLVDLKASVNLTADTDLASAALALACELEHSVYDCLYLSLAVREQIPFVSSDQKFLRKLSGQPLQIPLVDLHALPDTLP